MAKSFFWSLVYGILFGGCATHYTLDQCVRVNWRELGRCHGENAFSVRALKPYTRSCQEKHGVPVDLQVYFAERAAGIKEQICPRHDRVFAMAAANWSGFELREMLDECPESVRPMAIRAFEDGQDLFRLDKYLAESESPFVKKEFEHGMWGLKTARDTVELTDTLAQRREEQARILARHPGYRRYTAAGRCADP